MSKTFVFVLILLGLAAAGYVIIYNPNLLLSLKTTSIPSVNLNLDRSYRNSEYNFQFGYPTNFSFITPVGYFLKTPIVAIQANGAKYPKINLSGYSFTVSTGSDITTCTWGVEGGSNSGNPLTQKISINGTLFYKDTARDAAAGNFYDSRIYRTIRGSQCYEIVLTIHTTNVGNYPAEHGIKEVAKAPVWAELDSILQTFKFTR